MDVMEGSKAMSWYTEHPNLALEPSVMSMYPIRHPHLAKGPSETHHYMSVLLIIRSKKPVMAQSHYLFPMRSLTPSVMSQYLSMSPISSLAPS
jgi:hypothetical protein